MSVRGTLARYINKEEAPAPTASPPVNRPKLPRVWFGIALAIFGSLWSLLDLWNGLEIWREPSPVVAFLTYLYWYFCVFKIHRVVQSLDAGYGLDPLFVTGLTVLPSLVLSLLGIFVPENLESMASGNISALGGIFVVGLLFFAFLVVWQCFWSWRLTSFLKRNGPLNCPSWIPPLVLIFGSLISVFGSMFALLCNFSLVLFWTNKLRAILEKRVIKELESQSLEDATTTIGKRSCLACDKVSDLNSKFCNFCGTNLLTGQISGSTRYSKSRLSLSLERNAFRILGVFSLSTEAEVDKVVGALRRAARLGAIKKSKNDPEVLGQAPRESSDIQESLDKLRGPSRRIIERFFWFHRAIGETAVGDKNELLSAECRVLVEHDAALLALIECLYGDSDFLQVELWQDCVKRWLAVCESDEYWECFKDSETSCKFEPQASDFEFSSLRSSVVEVLNDHLVMAAKQALMQRDDAKACRIVHILRASSENSTSQLEELIVEELERQIELLCEEIESISVGHIKREENNSVKDINKNRQVCFEQLARFDSLVSPLLERVSAIVGRASDVTRRSKEISSLCLRNIAGDFTWADEPERAVETLEKAVEISRGTLTEPRMVESLRSMRENTSNNAIFKELKAVKFVPFSVSFFGCGLRLIANPFRPGGHDLILSSYMATYALTLFWFIPVFPIARYRFVTLTNGESFCLGRAKLRTFDRLNQIVGATAILYNIYGYHPPVSSSAVQPSGTTSTSQPISTKSEQMSTDVSNTSTSESVAESTAEAPSEAAVQDDRAYESTRSALRKQINASRAKLKLLKAEIESGENKLSEYKSLLDETRASVKQFEKLARNGADTFDDSEYQKALSAHNSLAKKYNDLLTRIRANISDYNVRLKKDSDLVDAYNSR